jgi:S1-C subfamily serine protease
MKKKLFTAILALMMISSTAYAATAINGMYKGRAVVKVVVNGEVVKSTVPGQLIDNATMLPLRAIAESLGASVTWDGKKAQASITTTQTPTQPVETGLTLEQLNKIGESVGLVYVLNAQGQQIGTGSGFITSGNVFVTNWHVAENATSLRIEFENKSVTVQTKDALFKNEVADLFGVKVDGYPSLKLNTELPEKGDKVYSLGYPHKKFTITEGNVILFSYVNTFVHDAKTEPGSSGGIVTDSTGNVIGINVGITEGTTGSHAIPSKVLQEELNNL